MKNSLEHLFAGEMVAPFARTDSTRTFETAAPNFPLVAGEKITNEFRRRDRAGVFAAYDENIVIREATSLPYGGEYQGLEGALKHAQGYRKVWDNRQTSAEQKLSPTFLDAGDYVIVLWRQRAASGKRKFDSSAASVYKLSGGKIVESEMFQDTAAVLQFLDSGEIENAD